MATDSIFRVSSKIVIFLIVFVAGDPCTSPPTPLNSRLVNDLVKCDDGFELFGDAKVTCSNGQWTSGFCATDVATNKPSNQSSTAYKLAASLGNDNELSTCSQTAREVNPWWKVDLLQPHNITSIAILSNMTSVDVEIRVGNNPLGLKNRLCTWQPAADFSNSTKSFPCAMSTTGRYISIQIIGTETLTLCSIKIYATDGLPPQRCSPDNADVVSFNGSCFEFVNKPKENFTVATEFCKERSPSNKGRLLSELELKVGAPAWSLITTTLEKLKPILKRPLFWIGIERDPGYTSRTWRWSESGLVVKKPNWAKDQPNNYNGEQNCAALDGGREWAWNDYGCSLDNFLVVCVYPPHRCGSPDVKPLTTVDVVNNSITSEITYSCVLPGYYLQGDATRSCLSTGFWSGSSPECRFVDCHKINKTIENGLVTHDNETFYGSKYTYTCNDGYAMSGSGVRSCGRDGMWSSEEPVCLNSTCPPPPPIINGTFTSTGRTTHSTTTYSCSPGHVLSGAPTITCLLGGTYSSPTPTCDFVQCGPLPQIENGSFVVMNASDVTTPTQTDALGAVALATCDLNYELEDENLNRVICSERAHWELVGARRNADTPRCQLIVCEEPDVPQGSFVTGYDFSVGSEIQYHCEEGHVMLGGTEIRRCTLKGVWSGVTPHCRFIDCGRAQSIPFGQLTYPSGKTYLHSKVNYSCAPNYRLNGPPLRTCLPTGTWSGHTPKCEEVRCTTPNLPQNSVATVAKNDRLSSQSLITAEQLNTDTTFKIGTLLKLRCERGYVFSGAKTQTCSTSATWSFDTPPKCTFVDCGEPENVNNAIKSLPSNTTYFGSAAIYDCAVGFRIGGNSRRLCLENGTWSGTVPGCHEITCPPIDSANATVDYTNLSEGGVAKYSCPKGTFIQGDNTRLCVSGRWSGRAAHCHPIICPPPPLTPNSRQFLVNTTTTYASTVEYFCLQGYSIFNEPSVLTCNEQGQWSSTPPTCLTNEEFSQRQSQSESSTAVIVGVSVGLILILVVIALLLWQMRKRVRKKESAVSKRSEDKAEPMSMVVMSQNYYDNPAVDPIYENLDDYAVGGCSDVTINGVNVG